MDLFLVLIIQPLIIFVFLFVFLGLIFWVFSGFISKSLFIPLPRQTFADIQKSLSLKQGSTVCHLGCGGGRFIFFLANNNPDASYIGVENSAFLYYVARLRLWNYERKTGKDNVKIIKSSLLKQSFSNVTHIFLYLYPNLMDDILHIFDKELASGVRLVSASFRFTQKKPSLEIDLNRKSSQLVRKLYIYEF